MISDDEVKAKYPAAKRVVLGEDGDPESLVLWVAPTRVSVGKIRPIMRTYREMLAGMANPSMVSTISRDLDKAAETFAKEVVVNFSAQELDELVEEDYGLFESIAVATLRTVEESGRAKKALRTGRRQT